MAKKYAPDKYLLDRASKIADEADSPSVSVIVQMQSQDQRIEDYVRLSAEAVRERMSVVSARELVPPSLQDLHSRRRSAERARSLRRASSGKQYSTEAIPFAVFPNDLHSTVGMLRRNGRTDLRSLKQSSVIRQSAESSKWRPKFFWSSSSAVLQLDKDQLMQLVKEVRQVADIFPNRTVKVPPVVRSRVEPAVVSDQKANTWGIAKTGAMACWGAFDARGKGVKVAILDTGVDGRHPDLRAKISNFAEFDRDGNSIIEGAKHAYDDGQHGTHVAGTIAGGNASSRWIGMAPDTALHVGLVLKGGSGTDAQILAGMQWAIEDGVDIISMSLGGLRMSADVFDTYTRTIMNAHRQGIAVVVAVGNDGSQTTGAPGNDFFAFTVGATDADDRAAGFSGGRTQIVETSRYIDGKFLPLVYSKPDITAPGVDVFSSIPSTRKGGRWDTFSGTSMATPHVAGAMSVMLSACPKLRMLQGAERVTLMQQLLTATVKELGESGQNHRFGFGRIDVLRAVGYARDLGYA